MDNLYKEGYWMIDERKRGLIFVSTGHKKERQLKEKTPTTEFFSVVEFRDEHDPAQSGKFRRLFRRKVHQNEPSVVTVQDIKDTVLFIANPNDLTTEFIRFFHARSVDKLIRSFIVYFSYYFQLWDILTERRLEAARKLRHSFVVTLENEWRDNLSELRSIVGREWSRFLMGMTKDVVQFHHMNNKNNTSLSDKDRKMFEIFIVVVVRCIFVAMQRKNFVLIEREVNRLMRTYLFSPLEHSKRRAKKFRKTEEEKNIMYGSSYKKERKLKQRSPLIQEVIYDEHDHRACAVGILDLKPSDERLRYLEACYCAPEEQLLDMGIGLGILGIPRDDVDPLLRPHIVTEVKQLPPRPIPPFSLPPKVSHKDMQYSETLPRSPANYKETEKTVRDRREQKKKWFDFIYMTEGTNAINSKMVMSHSVIKIQAIRLSMMASDLELNIKE